MFKTISQRFMTAPCRLLQQQQQQQQQRTFVSASKPLLKSYLSPEQWTKTNLKRLRKNELEDLAREHHLSTTGTKMDIVQRLLVSRNSPSSWPSEDTVERRVEEAVAKQHSHEKNEPGTKATPFDAIEQEFNESVSNMAAAAAAPEKKETGAGTSKTGDDDKTDDLEASNWVHAFELKVSHSHLRRPTSNPLFATAKKTTPTRATAALDHGQPSPVLMHLQDELEAEKEKNRKDTMPEDVNKHWVQAFEQKASSRGTRRQMLGTDTFSPRDAEPSGLEFIDSSLTTKDPTKTPLPHDQVSLAGTEKKEAADESSTHSSTGSPRNWLINSMIGAGLLVWVAGGEDGFKRIAALLTSTS